MYKIIKYNLKKFIILNYIVRTIFNFFPYFLMNYINLFSTILLRKMF